MLLSTFARLILSFLTNIHLREAFASEPLDGKSPHIYLRSVHHIPIERGWLDLRKDLGRDFPHFWGEGSDYYRDEDPLHRYLSSF